MLKPGETATKEELLEFLRPRVAKWWLPDDVVFIDEVPKTSVGKFSKQDLRTRFADYQLPDPRLTSRTRRPTHISMIKIGFRTKRRGFSRS